MLQFPLIEYKRACGIANIGQSSGNPRTGREINMSRVCASQCKDRPEVVKMHGRSWLASALFLTAISCSSTLKPPGKIIIDTDAGGDDAVAILLALAAEEKMKNEGFQVVAITCTYGNTLVTNVEQNVLKILTVANRSDIPVYAGAHRPLLRNFTMDYYFGEDGMGDIDFDGEITGKIDRSKYASVALVDLAREHAENISVVALGPVTNIAIAISLDPDFVNNVERFYIMGSSVPESENSSRYEEFNFAQDPPSNFIVLNGTRGLPAVLLPWETSDGTKISTEWRKNVLGAIDSSAIKFLNKVEARHLTGSEWKAADMLVSAVTLWPELITRSFLTNVTPVFEGAAQGSVEVDYDNRTGKARNVIVVQALNVPALEQMLLEVFA